MACIVVLSTSLVKTCVGEVVMLLASLEIVVFSVNPHHVLLEGDIMSNGFFGGIVYFSEFDRIIESR